MKQSRIGILLLALSIALMIVALVGCSGKKKDDGNIPSTTTTDRGSPLVPSPESTTSQTNMPETDATSNESMSETTTEQSATTTTKQETTTQLRKL